LTRSKPESNGSPETGDGSDSPDAPPAAKATYKDGAPPEVAPKRVGPAKPGGVTVELESSRQRYIGWAVFGIVVGSLLVWRLGTVAVYAGFILIAIGVVRAAQLVQTFLQPAGAIVVGDDEVRLPLGLHRAHPLTVSPALVTAVYFLRRSVPWNRSAPVLVVEVGDRALAYPRDWFASEADQRHLVHALLRGRGAPPIADPDEPTAASA
jgi:hypothetical protein